MMFLTLQRGGHRGRASLAPKFVIVSSTILHSQASRDKVVVVVVVVDGGCGSDYIFKTIPLNNWPELPDSGERVESGAKDQNPPTLS